MKSNPIFLILLLATIMICQQTGNAQNIAVKSTPIIQVSPKVVPVFVNGLAQKVPEFEDKNNWIRHDLWVETEFDCDGDGKKDRMHVDVTRPSQTETEGLKLPVIYESSPYFAGTGSGDKQYLWDVNQELNVDPKERKHIPMIVRKGERPIISNAQVNQWLPYGFIVIHSEAPGTGLSQGCPTVGGDAEVLAPKAVIDWLNGRAKGFTTPDGNEEVKAYWTTGKVGMIGTSYDGTIPVAAATTGVEGLEAIIPVAPNTSYYHYYRTNGLVRHPGGWLGEDIDFLYDWIHSNPDRYDWCNANIRDKEMALNQDRAKGDYNEFWASRDLAKRPNNFKAAVLMAHAFNDWNVVPEHSYNIIKILKEKGVPLQIYYHQGGHGGEPPFPMMNKWFTRYLFGIQNGVEKDPKAWIVRENSNRQNPTPYKDYPNPDAAPVQLFLTAGAPKTGNLVTTKVPKQGKETLTDDVTFSGTVLAQAESSKNRLLFVTPVLKDSVHISGVPSITIKLACSKTAANLSVWLVALPWNTEKTAKITDNIIDRGWMDPQNYKSMTVSEPLVPGKFYTMTFNLEPDDQIIKAGKQIGLLIMSSDRDFTLWPQPGTELTIDLNATVITLPVVGGSKALVKALK